MAIGAITMILTNVGLQIYNNWCGSRQNAELQRKREEFERAARARNTEHMWKLLREGQELTMQLEAENHKQRLKELKKDIDNLLQRLTYETTISNWPLNVLPIVMKNNAIGNLLTNQEEKVAMHVIFTRSNYHNFNKLVYPIVEKELEQYCNNHWSTISDHPLLFYSGAWKPQNSPTHVQVLSMRNALNNLPTLLITPFFRPDDGKLVFQVYMWGVGAFSTDYFDVPEIEPTDFQRPFNNTDDYDKEEGLLEEIVEDLVPYLECLIGYMADTYFWSSAGTAPHLPLLITNGNINTDGMKYLIGDSREYYETLLLKSEEKTYENPFTQNNLLNLYDSCSSLMDDNEKKTALESILIAYIQRSKPSNTKDLTKSLNESTFCELDLPFINMVISILKKEEWGDKILNTLEEIKTTIHFTQKPTFKIIRKDKLTLLEVLKASQSELFEFDEYDSLGLIIVPNHFMVICYYENTEKGFINDRVRVYISEHFYMPETTIYKFKKIKIDKNNLQNYIKELEFIMTEKDLEKLFSDSRENLDSKFSKVVDAFQQAIDSIKQKIDEEMKRENPEAYEVPLIVKKKLTYEDLTSWIRSNSEKKEAVDGVFATIDKAGLFDRERYKMYVCFTINKNPQLDDKSPKVIFAFSKLDEALMDMFGNNKTMQINLNK